MKKPIYILTIMAICTSAIASAQQADEAVKIAGKYRYIHLVSTPNGNLPPREAAPCGKHK